MSTDHQQYSLENQNAANTEYAAKHGYEIVKTYEDPGKSGLLLKHRRGLRQLLQDVVRGECNFRAVLVYDVSRWGRFQDNDEAAFYEFVCKTAGIPVVYSAEPFLNNADLPTSILKALKRTMAGEYSRELSVKTYEVQRRMVLRGFKMGSRAPYGFKRAVVSQRNPERRRLLEDGEWKGLSTDHIVLVHGDGKQIRCVRQMFSILLRGKGKIGPSIVSKELTRRGYRRRSGKPWDLNSVRKILLNPIYGGTYVWGRTSQKLRGPQVAESRDHWVVRADAFPGIVSKADFEQAQAILVKRRQPPSEEKLLADLRKLLNRTGTLSRMLIERSRRVRSSHMYARRFGLENAYEAIGLVEPRRFEIARKAAATHRLRADIASQMLALFPDSLRLAPRANAKCQPMLILQKKWRLAIVPCESYESKTGVKGWVTRSIPRTPYELALLCLATGGTAVSEYRLTKEFLGDYQVQIKFQDKGRVMRGAVVLPSLECLEKYARAFVTMDGVLRP